MLQQWPSTEHNKSAVFFLSESSTLRLISGYSPKKALAILLAIKKKAEIFYKEFLGIL